MRKFHLVPGEPDVYRKQAAPTRALPFRLSPGAAKLRKRRLAKERKLAAREAKERARAIVREAKTNAREAIALDAWKRRRLRGY